MTIADMRDALEELQGELLIVFETANAVESSLSEGTLAIGQVTWAFVGIIRGIDKAAKGIEKIIGEFVEMQEVLGKL